MYINIPTTQAKDTTTNTAKVIPTIKPGFNCLLPFPTESVFLDGPGWSMSVEDGWSISVEDVGREGSGWSLFLSSKVGLHWSVSFLIVFFRSILII